MQIVCPQCATSYSVADAAMGDGRMVHCTSCDHIWLATPADAMANAAAAAQSAGQAEAGTAGMNVDVASAESGSAGAETNAADAVPAAAESTDFLPPGGESPPDGPAMADAPSLVPDSYAAAGAAADGAGVTIDADPGDDDEFARQRAARREREAQRRRMRRPSWTTVILTLMVVIAAILAFRSQVVRAMPQTASLFARIGLPVNLRGLAFHQVAVEKEQSDGVAVLIVRGAVVNVTRRLIEVPRLRFALRDAAGAEVHHWTTLPAQPVLGPGDVMPFRTRLASPPENGEDILIRFLNRRDR
ncbi:MAG: DUF3426 domain-containing protein [Xanthobacteraceae bacterium]